MNEKTRGYLFAVSAVSMFAAQDGITKHLIGSYPPVFITMLRFWAFAVFVLLYSACSPRGIRQAARTHHPWLQVARGCLLALEIVLAVIAYKYAGLAMSQAVIQSTPLFVTVLSVPLLGETVGWKRATAVVAGLVGVLIIINPVEAEFGISTILPVLVALSFALYSIATKVVSRKDSSVTSLLYTGIAGAISITLIGPFYWTHVAPTDWYFILLLCVSGAVSHYFLIIAYGYLLAVEVQPVSYLQLVLNVLMGALIFNEVVTGNMIIGSIIVVAAGLFTVWRESRVNRGGNPRI
ncbi:MULTISPECIES: DMT family transporter [unclassified Rhizobium]|uniref:DMT family transporter n=1 Tax=unclassified Rhizobium TaxID=2613769 RepID=UPI0006FAFEAB|nr:MULTISPECIES: DMT family transporter [unclassified Rhizobium]KQV39333.1 hypothetical protein ASC86_22600 [Rhizobium sp. Root1212]KRD35338.1 hypothetical protein ASE37_21170 [Rhizobium sp. Root268]